MNHDSKQKTTIGSILDKKGLWILSMFLLWIVGFLVIYPLMGFPEGILETATRVLESVVHLWPVSLFIGPSFN